MDWMVKLVADIFLRIVATEAFLQGKFQGLVCNNNKLPGTKHAYNFMCLYNSFIRSIFCYLCSDFCRKTCNMLF